MGERSQVDTIIDMEDPLLTVRDICKAIGFICEGNKRSEFAVIARLAYLCEGQAEKAEEMRFEVWQEMRSGAVTS